MVISKHPMEQSKADSYGTAHEEVGGTFDKDSIVGAFGAAQTTPGSQ